MDIMHNKKYFRLSEFYLPGFKGKNLVTHNSGTVPGVAKVKGNAGITMHVEDLFTISLSGNWVGTRQVPRTDPYGPVKGYFLTNCVISTGKLFKNKITASLNIHNIFNTKWLDPGFPHSRWIFIFNGS